MRCPHCRGEIPEESQFCGVCGQNIHIVQVGSPQPSEPRYTAGDSGLSPSLFDLPVSPGARRIRIAMVLGLNLLLIGGGITLFIEYLHKRDRIARGASSLSKSGDTSPATEISAPQIGVNDEQQDTGDEASSGDSTANSTEGGKAPSSDSPQNPRTATESSGANRNDNNPGSGPSEDSPKTSAPANSGNSGTAASSGKPDAGASRAQPQPPGSGAADAGISAPTVAPELTEEEQARRVTVLAGKIGLVVERGQSQLGRCYESALKQTNPKDKEKLEGRIDLYFSVQPDGSAQGIRVRNNNTGSPVLANCLVGLVGSWTFPSSGSEALDFVWPFEFQAP